MQLLVHILITLPVAIIVCTVTVVALSCGVSDSVPAMQKITEGCLVLLNVIVMSSASLVGIDMYLLTLQVKAYCVTIKS